MVGENLTPKAFLTVEQGGAEEDRLPDLKEKIKLFLLHETVHQASLPIEKKIRRVREQVDYPISFRRLLGLEKIPFRFPILKYFPSRFGRGFFFRY